MKIIIQTICSAAVLVVSVYLFYFKTNMGFSSEYLPISGVPCYIAAIMFCVFVTLGTYFEVGIYINDKER